MSFNRKVFTVTKKFAPNTIPADYVATVWRSTGCRNTTPVGLLVNDLPRMFAPGELLLLHAAGGCDEAGAWSIEYQFQVLGEADLNALGL